MTWIDGKAIYRKTINIGSTSAGTQKTGDTGIRNWDTIIYQLATALENNINWGSRPDVFAYVSGSTLRYSAYSSNNQTKIYLTIFYTKNS